MGPDNPTYRNPYINNGMAIPASSLNPDRALMFIELVSQNEEYYNLLYFGIRGKHYEFTEDGKLTLPVGVTYENNGHPAGGGCPWGFTNFKFTRDGANANPETDRIKREVFAPKAIVPALITFVFDAEPVKAEYAAIKGLEDQFYKPLNFGLVENPVAYLAEYRDMLRRSNIEKVKTEMQRQIDIYMAANN